MTLEEVRLSGFKMPCAVRRVGGVWQYRKRVRLPDGSYEEISGTPTVNTRPHAEDAEDAHVRRVRPKESRVYFVAGGDLVKIGTTTDLAGRLQSLRTMSPVPLTLLGWMPGDVYDEHELHERFSHLRAHGEWFRRTDELLAFVEERAGAPAATTLEDFYQWSREAYKKRRAEERRADRAAS